MSSEYTQKDQRLGSALQNLAGEYVAVEANRDSMITITRVEVTDRGKRAMIFFTVLPDEQALKALDFLKRKRNDFRRFVTTKKIMGFAPRVDFEIDYGEKNRQRMDELSRES